MVANDEVENVKASYRLTNQKHRDKKGRFLESKNVGFDNPVYAFLKEPQLTDFVIERTDGKKTRSQVGIDSWNIRDHQIPIEQLFKRYGTHPDRGLTEEQAKRNREKYGKNKVVVTKKTPEFIKLCKNVLLGHNALLGLCAAATFALYIHGANSLEVDRSSQLNTGIAIVIVILISGWFSYYQEYTSNRIYKTFRKLDKHTAVVWREAKRREVDATDLVVGDIIEVKYGDRIPADIRIIESQGLRVDNCLLNGDSQPQNRRPTFTHKNPLETKNLIFFSTTAIAGSAKGVVIRVGERTFMGSLAAIANAMNTSKPPLAKEMERIVQIMATSATFFAAVTFLVAMLALNYTFGDALIFIVGIVIANVPENLNITLTIQLALIAKKMAQKHCYVKHLQAVDTLGAASVICTDKTGTLTQNKMSVAHLWFNDCIAEADTAEYTTGHLYDVNDTGYNSLMNVATLCSRAKFRPGQDHLPVPAREVDGDGSEAAILKHIEAQFGNCGRYRDRHPKVCEIPFNSTSKFQVSVHDMKDPEDPRYLLVLKGAPEQVMSMCTTIMIDGVEYPLDEYWQQRIYRASGKLAKLGERVLGFCDRRLDIKRFPRYHLFDAENPDFLREGFRFIGIISLIDPPRAAVPAAIAKCRTAGIKVVMITGEHPTTATAIAQAVGILSEDAHPPQKDKPDTVIHVNPNGVLSRGWPRKRIVTGQELSGMTPEELDQLLSTYEEVVFARTLPEQKHVIVESFKRLGHVVAVTGDKVQDMPALKRADIGIALGILGADAAKEAADMILMDDNFASIVAGIQDGRLLFDNLKKLIRFTLADNIAVMYAYVLFILFKMPLPVGILAMTIIAMCIDVLPAISLAYEEPAVDLMKLQPRNIHRDVLISQYTVSYSYGQISILEVSAAFCSYFVTMAYNGFLPLRLFYINQDWGNAAINDLEDSYGQEWSYHNRRELLFGAQTAFFIGIVVAQWANALACKTRRLSVFQKGMRNRLMNISLVVSPAIACFVIYTPYVNEALDFRPVSFGPWCAALPFALLIFVYDELRRFAVRNFADEWVRNEFYR